MSCGTIEGGESGWKDLARFLSESGIPLSHGYCPSCGEVALAEAAGRQLTPG